MPLQPLAVFFLVSVAIGGIAWVLIFPILSGERRVEKRIVSIAKSERAVSRPSGRQTQKSRREQVEEALKEIEAKGHKQTRAPLTVRISQAGLGWSKQRFIITAAFLGIITFLIVFVFTGAILPALGFGFGASFGAPLWILKYLKNRREAKFIEAFPDAIEVIVRGIKAGLPLLDSLRVIVNDSPEPIRGEFRTIVETQAIGVPLGDACIKLYERIPLAEANFFGIVISIQQKSGGNLSEALSNLSRVLRDRKRMKGKIKAMSQEAKASAAIIGCLPVIVALLVYITNPGYISLLWTTPVGHLLLAGSAIWMSIGIMTMKKMINFDF